MVRASVTRDAAAQTTRLNVSDLRVSKLAIRHGQQQYRFDREQPISIKLAADVQAADAPGKTIVQQIRAVNVTQLAGSIPGAGGAKIAALSMPTPIVITDLGAATPTVNGAIKLDGRLDEVTALLAVVQGTPEQLPYSGDYSLAQTVKTQGQRISLNGEGNVAGLKVRDKADANHVLFSEDRVNLANQADIALDQKTAIVRSLSVEMPQSQALGVKFNGQVVGWDKARTIKGVDSDAARLDLTYDLEKLWAIARPMLSPEMQTQYKDLKVKGRYTKTFTISGAYPDRPTMPESIASLNADGSLALDLLDLPQGLTIQSFELPFGMKKGLLRLAAAPAAPGRRLQSSPAADAPAGARAAPVDAAVAATAICNDGALNLNEIALDMTRPDPLLSVARKHVLLKNVKLNPVLADAIGHGNLLFKDADQASGLLDVQVIDCKNVPLGDLIKKKQNAKAQVVCSVTDLQLDGPVPAVMGQALNLGGKGINGYIKNGTLTLENGEVQSDFAVTLTQVSQQKDEQTGRKRTVSSDLPLKFTGGVNLASSKLRDFYVNIPAELIRDEIGGREIRKVLPGGLAVAFTGTTDKFHFDIQQAITKSVGNSLIPGIGGDGKNPLENIGDLFGGGKKKDRGR